ncbi:Probable Asp/Glu racemase [Mycobacteroides abscessus]|nr:Probable Asp/Glu racemase [Mycobacteroides abscessus]
MRIRVINPNTTEAMTKSIAAAAQSAAWAQTSVTAVNPSMGPASIESHYDEALSVPGILAEIRRAESEGTDGYVLACFGDPGLDAARELATGPVLGIAEAAMHTASHLGRGFSVVTTLERTAGRAWDLAERMGCRVSAAGSTVAISRYWIWSRTRAPGTFSSNTAVARPMTTAAT